MPCRALDFAVAPTVSDASDGEDSVDMSFFSNDINPFGTDVSTQTDDSQPGGPSTVVNGE